MTPWHDPITVKVTTDKGKQLIYSKKHHPHIPSRNDVIFWEGENYKVIYRKFIYNVGNQELSRVHIKVQQIDKKF